MQRVARTTGSVVRVFSLSIIPAVSYSTAVSKLRRLFLSNRYFFITVRLLKRRWKQVARRCALFSASPRLFKRKCQSPPGHAHMNPQGIGERPQRSEE